MPVLFGFGLNKGCASEAAYKTNNKKQYQKLTVNIYFTIL